MIINKTGYRNHNKNKKELMLNVGRGILSREEGF